jgi:endonuclease YncB( thermonuclease family)
VHAVSRQFLRFQAYSIRPWIGRLGIAVWWLVLGAAVSAAADPTANPPLEESAGKAPGDTVSPWTTGGAPASARADGTGGAIGGAAAVSQAMAAPGTVIQGGAIPPGWQPQAIPYQAPGPDGKPITVYIAPTYVFTYAVGPPVAVSPPPTQVNRIQAYRPAPAPGWNYQAQGMAPVGTTLPPVTRSPPVPYQYPPGSPALAGQPMVPPAAPSPALAPAPAMVAQAAPIAPPTPAIQAPPSQWVSAPPESAPPTIGGQALAGAAPAVMAGTAGAIAAANQAPPPTAAIAPPPADPNLTPVGTPPPPPPPPVADPAPPQPALQPTSPSLPAAGPRATTTHLWRVVGVHDGDTITCLDENNTQQKVRLAEIDAPELGQDFGKVARESLAEMVFGKTVTFQDEGKDRYGRWIGHVDVNGTDVNRQMVATGNAWHYADYSRDPSLAGLQSQAQAQRLGLWSQPDPVPPWEFRASLKKAAAG